MTNKLKYFIGNWKMFGTFSDFKIIKHINQYTQKTQKILKNRKIILCVPNTLIYYFNKKLKSKFIALGAQNCHSQSEGPFTGSVSASMLKNAGAKYIILGHSENRHEGETNKLIKKKIILSHKNKLNIIYCIGETLFEKKSGKTLSILKSQIQVLFDKNVSINKIIIAYEPVWSIGTNKIPKTLELKNIIKFIKNYCRKNIKIKKLPKILYGGSVNSKNISLFSVIPDIDGFLIGGASQSPKKFIDIVKNYYK